MIFHRLLIIFIFFSICLYLFIYYQTYFYQIFKPYPKHSIIENKLNQSIIKKSIGHFVRLSYISIQSNRSFNYHKSLISNKYLRFLTKHKFPEDGISYLGRKSKFGIFPYETNDFNWITWYQSQYMPEHIVKSKITPKKKRILFVRPDEVLYNLNVCPVKWCDISFSTSYSSDSDVVIWYTHLRHRYPKRPPKQIWGFMIHESPLHSVRLTNQDLNKFNWTITYRRDSTIPDPYESWVPYDLTKPEPKQYPLPTKNYARGKTKIAAWFVSNCGPKNNRQLIVQTLSKYIKVDIYGNCGKFKCPRSDANACFNTLKRDYKFYMSFENSNCRDYITEKFSNNALKNDVIPIVMGAHPEDYKRVAPPHSYIHIEDFPSIKELADYMKYLDKNDTAYNEYFAWKEYGALLRVPLECRVCMMAHEADKTKIIYDDIEKWWHGDYFYKKKSNINIFPWGSNICSKTPRWDMRELI